MNPGLAEIFSGRHTPPRNRTPTLPEDLLGAQEEDSINILCINCQEFISVHNIEKHSKSCITISETVKRLDLYSPLVQVRFKLEKLRDLLNSLLNSRPGDSNYNSIFLRLIGKLLEVKEATDAEKNKQVMEALSSLMVTFKGSSSLLIYGERLKSLAYEQMLALREVSEDKIPEVRISARPPQKSMAYSQLNDIKSETSSVVSRGTDFTPASSRNEEQSMIEFTEQFENPDEVDLQRYFYSQCLAVKLTYNSRSLAQYVSISKLFDEAKRQRLPIEEWATFIRQELKAPERWLDQSKIRKSKHSQPKNFRNPSRFDTIIEEEETPRSFSRRFQ
mmetsp:Transcript_1681/g.3600  ORF Transcript_1681/g.3600 Transcript_1681/m.3600 type:complete len:333 (+) Transcript_1681:2-1000(+)